MKHAMHYAHSYLLDPSNPITINLIGAGGTGNRMFNNLVTLNYIMLGLGKPGLFVTLFDPDIVTKPNLGRQLFASSELGLNKAVVLVARSNRFIGTSWKAIADKYNGKISGIANITITCVDNNEARFEVASTLKSESRSHTSPTSPLYWIDVGNSATSGQAILSTVGNHKQPKSKKYKPVGLLPFITDEFKDLLIESEKDPDQPSCSLEEAITKQDPFINPSVADNGIRLLWRLFRYGMTDIRGIFTNHLTERSVPLKVGK